MRPQKGKSGNSGKRIKRNTRKNTFLTFAGVAIAFGTFLVKDAMREHLKDLSDSINTAEGFYSLKGSGEILSLQLVELETEMIPLSQQLSKTTADSSTLALTRAIVTQADSNVPVALQNVEDLLEKLPERNDFEAAIKTVKKQVDEAHEEVQKSLKDMADKKEALASVLPLLHMIRSLLVGVEITVLGDAVLTKAKEVRANAERRYVVCTWISYFLYPFGLLLGLIGKLSGNDLLESE